MPYEPRVLTPEQIEHFLAHGYVTLHECFTRKQAAEWTRDLWVRLGMDPHDARTWTVERVHMPVRRKFDVGEFAPKAWNAILDLVGGPDRIDPAASSWTDGFIVNLGPPPGTSSTFSSPNPSPTTTQEDLKSRALSLTNWHVDGDFFTHFLDSREQALLVIPLLSDIAPHGGATFIAPDSLALISHYLYNHPEGVVPRDKTWTPAPWGLGEPDKSREDPREAKRRREERGESVEGFWDHVQEVKRCEEFVELTGRVGDVVLLHPFMLHSASPNTLRVPRVITNPPVGLRAPFVFKRDDVNEYSIVERATLRALGRKEEEGLVWEVKGERREVVPERVRVQREMAERERRRLEDVERMRERERVVVEGRAEAVAVA